MPSFDIVSEFDKQEVVNAIDQSGREIVVDTISKIQYNNITK